MSTSTNPPLYNQPDTPPDVVSSHIHQPPLDEITRNNGGDKEAAHNLDDAGRDASLKQRAVGDILGKLDTIFQEGTVRSAEGFLESLIRNPEKKAQFEYITDMEDVGEGDSMFLQRARILKEYSSLSKLSRGGEKSKYRLKLGPIEDYLKKHVHVYDHRGFPIDLSSIYIMKEAKHFLYFRHKWEGLKMKEPDIADLFRGGSI
ncbi:hypothetical protein TWF481_002681 [Arthrobotrys musiformis]|uniref:Uncharacterized protein n=1 Tax=Arthrobotrys musiformis TaxID=47236 RepID=A0AAV9VSM6_9PEZI